MWINLYILRTQPANVHSQALNGRTQVASVHSHSAYKEYNA